MTNKLDYEYLLGDGEAEIARLRFQHSLWGPVSVRLFDQIGVGPRWCCLDVGSGPGFVTADLQSRVGDTGEVTALEPSEFFHGWLARRIKQNGWPNTRTVRGSSFETELPNERFNLTFSRWVIGSVPDPEAFLRPLLPALKKGGIIAIQDHVHEGCLLYP